MVTQDYIPPHLQGQISDIRQDPDGNTSFVHPAGNLGQPDQDSARISLSPAQAKATFDAAYRGSNPEAATNDQYMPPRPIMFGERLQRGAAGWLKGHAGALTGSTAKNIATSGLLGALAAGAGGAWLAAKNDKPILDKAVLFALLGGAGAAGASALVQRQNNKNLAAYDMGKQASITGELSNDPELTPQQRAILADAVSNLPQHDRSELETLVARMGGAGIGLMIAKFLGMRGLLSPLAMALIGGAIGDSMTKHKPQYNAFGQPVYDT